jgi:hypothetical protein
LGGTSARGADADADAAVALGAVMYAGLGAADWFSFVRLIFLI